MKTYNIYVDGGARDNGSNNARAAWAANIYDENNKKLIEVGNFKLGATNNQMELTSLIAGLNMAIYVLKNKLCDKVIIFQDSHYSVEGFNSWIYGWIKSDALVEKKNSQLWKLVWELKLKIEEFQLNVSVREVRGHSGVEGNESADNYLNDLMDNSIDTGIEYSDPIPNGLVQSYTPIKSDTIIEVGNYNVTDVEVSETEVIIHWNKKDKESLTLKIGTVTIPSYLLSKLSERPKLEIPTDLDGNKICPNCGSKLTFDNNYYKCDVCNLTFN